jgi:hypothetical protein
MEAQISGLAFHFNYKRKENRRHGEKDKKSEKKTKLKRNPLKAT